MSTQKEICSAFGISLREAQPITEGLINQTFKITDASGKHYLLQQINTAVFKHPQQVQENFVALHRVLQLRYTMPALIPTAENQLYLSHEGQSWRCFTFMENSFTPSGTVSEDLAYTTARCFGDYTKWLSEANPTLHTILPRFHDLGFRAQQLVQAREQANASRLKMAAPWLSRLDAFNHLLKHYDYWTSHQDYYPPRILHHDAKPSNILFHSQTQKILCPIDLDTTQSGLFFSDLGDMIRSMVPSLDENNTQFADIEARASFLQALTEGYMDATHQLWTRQEREALPLSGQVLLYMQAIRFLADYLNNDTYYQTRYEQHNLDRAINQITVLEQLERIT
ncbi:MAG: aminoglycoside phosphotransferase family protein [Chitinophagaceae bacterium]|nr:aminoglycoside phosphotransferase family protein [Chitinophagaceae bacterium]